MYHCGWTSYCSLSMSFQRECVASCIWDVDHCSQLIGYLESKLYVSYLYEPVSHIFLLMCSTSCKCLLKSLFRHVGYFQSCLFEYRLHELVSFLPFSFLSFSVFVFPLHILFCLHSSLPKSEVYILFIR